MKTITSFLLFVLLLLISGVIAAFAVQSVSYAQGTYFESKDGTPITFVLPLLTFALLQIVLAGFIFINAMKCLKLFIGFYTTYREKVRDNKIFDLVEEAEYDKLYKDLRDTNEPDKLKTIIREFFTQTPKNTPKQPNGLEALLSILSKKN